MRRTAAATVGRRPPPSVGGGHQRNRPPTDNGNGAAPPPGTAGTNGGNAGGGGGGGGRPTSAAPDTTAPSRPVSVHTESTTIAFACYDELTNQILLEECRAHGGTDTERVVEGFMNTARPNLVLVGGRVVGNSGLLWMLTRGLGGAAGGGDDDENDDRAADGGARRRQDQPQQQQPNQNRNGNNGQQQQQQQTEDPIPYRLLKSGAYDLRTCRSLILTKLRVLTLLKNNRRAASGAGPAQGGGGGGFHGGENPSGPPAGGSNHPNNPNGAANQNHTRERYFPNSSTHHHHLSAPSSYHSISSLIDLTNSPALVRALGSLLSYLQSTLFRLEEGGTVTVNAVRHAHSSRYMRIDSATLRSLHIFATEHHPLVAKGRGKDKDGFSLFTLLDRTKSKLGRQRLREYMVKPLLDHRAIERRYDGVDLFLRSDNQSNVVGTLLGLLGKVGAVDKILLRMQKCHASPNDFLVLSGTLSAAVSVVQVLGGEVREGLIRVANEAASAALQRQQQQQEEEGQADQSALRQLAFLDDILTRCHVPVLRDLHDRISSIVDEEMTAETRDSVVIHYGFHEELDAAKEAFDTLDETLSAVGSQVLTKHPELRQLKVVFLPQVGFLITLDKRHHSHNVATNEFPDLPPTFTFVFVQDTDAYFKNPDMRQLDDEVGDLDAFIKDTESMIVSELEEDILDCEVELRSTFGALADLDCILAFAGCAADLNFVRPEIVPSDPSSDQDSSTTRGARGGGGEFNVYVENGRHPLQELVIDDEFIANDTMIDSTNRVNVVTGPNFSGKSCYARQVGVLVYLAHIGCFVPADRAKISITDQILARISSVETCAVPQSSFQQDLTQMATILRRATPRSLVLIDEFGKGTAPSSGIAVLTSALRKLSKIKCKVVCTTHFLEIFSLGLLKDGQDGIKALQMAVHVPSSDEDSAVPLFKLEVGVANSSAGLVCAKMAGVKRSVVGRANEILGALKEGRPVQPLAASANSNSAFQPGAKSALRFFLGIDSWSNATDGELATLQEKILCM